MRFFNVAGPCFPADHYLLPPTARLPDLHSFVAQKLYWVVHAARQTGKTTAMLAFVEELRAGGWSAMYATLEQSQGFEAVADAEPLWLVELARAARGLVAPPDPLPLIRDWPVGDRLREWLGRLCAAQPERPFVVVLDEADAVSGPALVSLLRQLRAGYVHRGAGRFPTSVALVGMRELRDYLAFAKDGSTLSPGSPFNVKSASLSLRSFEAEEVAALLAQHTADTGQAFTAAAAARLYEWTLGQPFLVNAMARICVQELATDRGSPVTVEEVEEARERLVRARTTHLYSLGERLEEERVARVLRPILLGDEPLAVPYASDDFQYAVDLGLVRQGPDGAEIANPMYRDVLVRELTTDVQEALPRPWWPWRSADGGLDFEALVAAFRQWWRENEDAVLAHGTRHYPEALPHLAFMAFLQRVVNGGGTVTREYAAGRGAIDIVVAFGDQRFVVELKRVARGGHGRDRVVQDGVAQLDRYLGTLGATEGWLLVFDQRGTASWDERLWSEDRAVGNRTVHLRGA